MFCKKRYSMQPILPYLRVHLQWGLGCVLNAKDAFLGCLESLESQWLNGKFLDFERTNKLQFGPSVIGCCKFHLSSFDIFRVKFCNSFWFIPTSILSIHVYTTWYDMKQILMHSSTASWKAFWKAKWQEPRLGKQGDLWQHLWLSSHKHQWITIITSISTPVHVSWS